VNASGGLNYQALYAQRWGQLHHPHVRALAWLLDSPDLLDPAFPDLDWAGKLADPTAVTPAIAHWLAQLDRDPAPLLAALGERPFTRLGLYAEKLMAFFYGAQGRLVAHGLQVRASRNDTVGEFDFLLETGEEGVEHIELATKFYLLEGEAPSRFDTLIGPNLADSLGAKMRKIVGKQLALADHPAAQAMLTRPVTRARALVKGWLFYPLASSPAPMAGITPDHCRGFWCALAERGRLDPQARWVLLPRLSWLAPYRVDHGAALEELGGLSEIASPVMVAALGDDGAGGLIETERGFIVPDDWREKASRRV